ncbi:MAG: hypothetical protein KAQ84_02490, partial [Thermoplasmatales archaeon]|nr:hypothetical protein [Thermoplasmatales archaeon]
MIRLIGLFRKGLVCSLVVLFVFSSLSLNISGSFKDVDQKKCFESISVDPGDDVSIACYSFGRSGMRKHEVVLSYDDADLIFEKFEELKYKITHCPFNEETQELKLEFIDLLEENCVIPSGLYEDDLISLLNPRWFKRLLNKQDFSGRKSIFGMANGGSATAFLCSIASGGLGWVFPPLMIPRPRFATAWYGYGMTETSISELYTLRGFFAVGQHLGLSAGFVGMGLAFAFPGVQPIYGLIGYAFIAGVFGPADIYWYPLNSPPVISEEDPVDGSEGVPLSLSELSFRISDDDGDLMSYSVTTSPDVGSGSGNLKPDGTYSVSISGLQGLTQYTWNVEVSDGKDTSVSSFSFLTEAAGPIVSNPSPENGATDVSVNLSQLSFHLKDLQGDLMDYTVETSPDIGSGSSSGVGDGTYTVDVSNL